MPKIVLNQQPAFPFSFVNYNIVFKMNTLFILYFFAFLLRKFFCLRFILFVLS